MVDASIASAYLVIPAPKTALNNIKATENINIVYPITDSDCTDNEINSFTSVKRKIICFGKTDRVQEFTK